MKTINNSIGKPNYSQRLNPDDPATPWNETLETCNVTAAVTALGCAGWDLAKLNKGLHERPAMDLLKFMRTNQQCNDLWSWLDPKHATPMNEWMDVLAVGIGEYIGETVPDAKKAVGNDKVRLIYAAPRDAIHWHLMDGGTLVIHGNFTFTRKDGTTLKSGHYEALVGFSYDETGQNPLQIPVNASVKSWTVDDPFGDPNTNYVSQVGNDVTLLSSTVDFVIKPENSAGGKDAIFIPKFAG